MSDERNDATDVSTDDTPGPVGDGIRTQPPANPEVDEDAMAKGEETLGRVKPY